MKAKPMKDTPEVARRRAQFQKAELQEKRARAAMIAAGDKYASAAAQTALAAERLERAMERPSPG